MPIYEFYCRDCHRVYSFLSRSVAPDRRPPCPKCGRLLAPSGVVSVDGGPELPVYQCDECLVMGEVLGVRMETALTFCIDERGRAFKPAAPDLPLFPDPSDN